jgi:hypothetical protein
VVIIVVLFTQILYNDTNAFINTQFNNGGRPPFKLRVNKLMNLAADAFVRARAQLKGLDGVSVVCAAGALRGSDCRGRR